MVADSAFVGLGVSVWEIWFVHPFSSPSAPGSRGPEGRMLIVLNLAAAIPRALQEELIKSKNDKFFVVDSARHKSRLAVRSIWHSWAGVNSRNAHIARNCTALERQSFGLSQRPRDSRTEWRWSLGGKGHTALARFKDTMRPETLNIFRPKLFQNEATLGLGKGRGVEPPLAVSVSQMWPVQVTRMVKRSRWDWFSPPTVRSRCNGWGCWMWRSHVDADPADVFQMEHSR